MIADPRNEDTTRTGGLAPEERNEFEYPSLKEQEQLRRLDVKNFEVENWMLHVGLQSKEDGGVAQFLDPHWPTDLGELYNDSLVPVDDAASMHENRLLDGQVYFNPEILNQVDWKLSSQPYQWNDPPRLPYTATTTLQPPTSNAAIMRWIWRVIAYLCSLALHPVALCAGAS